MRSFHLRPGVTPADREERGRQRAESRERHTEGFGNVLDDGGGENVTGGEARYPAPVGVQGGKGPAEGPPLLLAERECRHQLARGEEEGQECSSVLIRNTLKRWQTHVYGRSGAFIPASGGVGSDGMAGPSDTGGRPRGARAGVTLHLTVKLRSERHQALAGYRLVETLLLTLRPSSEYYS